MKFKNMPMTQSALVPYVDAYSSLFQGWSKPHKTGYRRVAGAFAQQVWFENLRSGAYRPVSAVSILVASQTALLYQWLDIRHREILPREHHSQFAQICEAMQNQFVPSVSSPLVESELLALCERSAQKKMNDVLAMSALYAYYDQPKRSMEQLDVFFELAKELKEPQILEQLWIVEADKLRIALEKGDAKEHLLSVRAEELSRLGMANTST